MSKQLPDNMQILRDENALEFLCQMVRSHQYIIAGRIDLDLSADNTIEHVDDFRKYFHDYTHGVIAMPSGPALEYCMFIEMDETGEAWAKVVDMLMRWIESHGERYRTTTGETQ